ncbi:LexA family protein [Aquirhabdus parva]|uniref:DNA polymerase V n=1 Tax=Aquirhabdus parva TaxID=2283318 RepID=A0A345P2Z6_9GAMM|nr:translesion error-prone DNA polymerase V autoproteolytic subunit [Aquirhabdus parva]AXI01655.1 DNA polymerase V [Aquirhabdus parva]
MSEQSKKRGGRRDGAGPKFKYNEPTVTMRIPQSRVEYLKAWLHSQSPDLRNDSSNNIKIQTITINPKALEIPLMLDYVAAGFPAPVAEAIDRGIDFNKELIRNRASTFVVTVNSLSMLNIGIDIGDKLVVDRSIEPKQGHVVLAVINTEFTVKTLMIEGIGDKKIIWLRAENPDFASIFPMDGDDFLVWGVVTNVLKDMLKK